MILKYYYEFTITYCFVFNNLKNLNIIKLYFCEGFPITTERVNKKEMGGGTILDLGIYTIQVITLKVFDWSVDIRTYIPTYVDCLKVNL